MTTPFVCPDCGGPLDLDDQAETEQTTWHRNLGGMPYVETVLRPAVVASCSTCEFCIEVKVGIDAGVL